MNKDTDLIQSFGTLVAQKIIREDLKFLNIDSIILNDNIINIEDGEYETFQNFYDTWRKMVSDFSLQHPKAKSAWADLLNHRKAMEQKYLPKVKVECMLPEFDLDLYKDKLVEIINQELWDCDASHYFINSSDDVKFETISTLYHKILTITLNTDFTKNIK